MQLVVFELDGNEYGIDALKVNGILRAKKFSIKKMPGVSDSVEGIINLRGKVSFIFNLGKKFHIPTTVVDQESKFIMINIENVVVGCIVDEVTDIIRIDEETIKHHRRSLNKMIISKELSKSRIGLSLFWIPIRSLPKMAQNH